ncbi:hypothetical protein CPB83DRAFT_845013 [Crepidotus variabilis]|uniref:F-box domain-containing protein n=1 Tax=Crepidotus variabilis TaxID=179855 RepID=A0A9P6JVM0_9AGAR|nr:hypothetical protein CPB83DRAFT_845013 [Crepidotus variabilis]
MSGQLHDRNALQSQLALLHQQAAEISRLLNFLSITSVLNCDILFKIFQFLCPDSKLQLKSLAKQPTADLRNASQVCRGWRELAMESPSLWGTLLNCNGESSDWLFELVRRAKASPVSIVLDLKHAYSKRLLVIAPKLRTIESVTVFSSWNHISDELFNILTKAIQNAATVHLHDSSLYTTRTHGTHNRRGPLTNIIHQPFAQLRELSIVNPPNKPNPSEWVRILQGFPQLVHLRLDWAIGIPQMLTARSLPKTFNLPRLQSFTLSCHEFQSDGAQLLTSFVPSKPYALRLNCTVIPLSEAADRFLQGVQKWSSVWLQTVFSPGINKQIHVISSRRKLAIRNVDMPDSHSFNITFKWAEFGSKVSQFEAKMLETLQPILQLAIEVQITPDCKHGVVRPSLNWKGFTSLRTLCFSNHPEAEDRNQGLLAFLDALINDLVRSSDPPLRNLRCLSLKRLNHWAENSEPMKLATLFARGRESRWEHNELQVHRCSPAIGESLQRKFGRLLNVSIFSAYCDHH